MAHVRDVSIGGDHLFAKEDENVLHSVLLVRGIDLTVPLEQRSEIVEQRLQTRGSPRAQRFENEPDVGAMSIVRLAIGKLIRKNERLSSVEAMQLTEFFLVQHSFDVHLATMHDAPGGVR